MLHQKDKHFSLPSLWYQTARWEQEEVGTCKTQVKMHSGRCLMKKACESNLGKEGIGWKVDPPKAQGSLES